MENKDCGDALLSFLRHNAKNLSGEHYTTSLLSSAIKKYTDEVIEALSISGNYRQPAYFILRVRDTVEVKLSEDGVIEFVPVVKYVLLLKRRIWKRILVRLGKPVYARMSVRQVNSSASKESFDG